MSQEKVNQYKNEKNNRKKQLAKQKQMKTIKTIGAILVSILLIVAIVFSTKFLRGDFDKVNPTTYSEQELSSIRDKIGITTTPENESKDSTTKDTEETTTLP